MWRERGMEHGKGRKEGRLLALGSMIVSLGEARTYRDLVLSMYLSALLRLECLCFGTSSSSTSSMILFKEEARGFDF